MECALSGQNATHPVVSRHGHVFERDLILKHLEATGKCPITGEPMSPEELIEVKINTAVKPRPVTATHIPGLLQIFQNEWDAVMLETFTLKQQLDSTRQELANALYQHDAACRVIARLIRERDEARNALAQVAHHVPSSSSEDVNMESADRTVTKEIQKKIQKLGQQLSKERKSRNVPSLPAESIQGFKQISTQNLHKTTKPGVLCVDIHPVDTNLIITGGADETAVIYNRQTKKKIDTLSGHSKQVLDVLFHPTETVAFTSSFDKTVRVWGQDSSSGTMQTKHVVSTHAGPVTAIDLHPLGNYLLSASQDRTWGFHDIHTGICLAQVSEASIENGFTTAMVHPDGNLFATGSGADVQIWDICNQKVAANLAQAHPGGISSLCFSENGFYFVTGGSDSLKLWDLRKLADPRVYNFESNFNLSSLSIDYSGKYLAAAGNEIRLFKTKTLEPIVALTNHSQTVTDVKWGRGDFLASTSLDRSLRIFGV